MPVAIVGMHRSGTSLLVQMLHRSGLYLGDQDRLFGPNAENPEGYWEHTGFHRLNEAVLTELGGGWDEPPVVPERWEDVPRLAAHAADARQLLDEFSGREPWGWKDPRTSLTLSLWLELIPDLRVIVCVRNPLEVALSLQRRDMLSGSRAIRLWQLYNELALVAPAARRMVVAYERVLSAGEAELARVLTFLGIAPGAHRVREAATVGRDDLRHSRFGMADLYAVDCRPDVLELYARLQAEAGIGSRSVDRATSFDGSERIVDDRAVEALIALQPPARTKDAAEQRKRGGPTPARTESPEATDQIARIRELASTATAPASTLAVISKGDQRLIALDGRNALHFPQDDKGAPLGYHPSSGRSAVAQLEVARAKGAEYLLIPAPSLWWLEHYPELRRHLRARYLTLHADAETAGLFDLRVSSEAAGRARATVIEMVDAVRSALGREPTLLDWGTDLNLAEVLPQAHPVVHVPGHASLPHADASVDVVALRPSGADAVQEARRVAAAATIEFAPDNQLPPSLELKLPGDESRLRDVSIVLVLVEHPAATAFLRSFEETLPHDFEGELVVVDGRRRRERGRSAIGRLAGRCRLIEVLRPDRAREPLSGAQAGVEASTKATLVLLRGETLLLPGWLRPLLDLLRDRPKAGAVGGIVIAPDGTLLHAGGLALPDGSAVDLGHQSAHPDDSPFAYVREVDFCTSLILATRRQAFFEAGGFESSLSVGRAEMEYGRVVQQLGMECYFQPASAVVDLTRGRRPQHLERAGATTLLAGT